MIEGARVEVVAPGGRTEGILRPGAVVGRSPLGFQVVDAEVSEAHALCSLRADGLVLFPLRGRLTEGGREVERCVLSPGTAVELAERVTLCVLDLLVEADAWVARAEGRTVPLLPYAREVMAGPLRLRDPSPDGLWAWHAGGTAWIRRPGGATLAVTHTHTEVVGDLAVEIVRAAILPTTPTSHAKLSLELGAPECQAQITDPRGNVLLQFALRQAELLLAIERPSRATPAHWTRVVEVRDGSVNAEDFRPFEKLRDQVRDAAARLGFPVPFTRPRAGFLDINREEYRVVRASAAPRVCPTCGRGPGTVE